MTVFDLIITATIVAAICGVFYFCWSALTRLQIWVGKLVPKKREHLKGECYDCGAYCDDCILDEISPGNPQLFCRECDAKHWQTGES